MEQNENNQSYWIYLGLNQQNKYRYKCAKCSTIWVEGFTFGKKARYCPSCGRRMVKSVRDNCE